MKTNHKHLPSWPDSFFNRAVQKVLRQKHEPPVCKGTSRRDALAYPIEAFNAIEELASDQGAHSQKHIDFLWYYGLDPLFCSELLLAVTKFHQFQSNRTDGEFLAEDVESQRSAFDTTPLRRMLANGLVSMSHEQRMALCRRAPTAWKDIAAYLEERIKPLKGHAPTATTLIRSTYPHEVKRRWMILKDWQPHIKAWAKIQALHSKSK